MSDGVRAAVLFDEPLARHTAWRTGGPCDAYVVANDEEAVQTVLADCKAVGWKLTVLGAGTRSVVREGGLEGVVLKLGQAFVSCAFVEPDLLVIGGATPVPAALAFAASHGLAADPALYAVPGTFGASVLMDDWHVASARVARSRRVGEVDAAALGPRFKGVVVEATVRLERVGSIEAEARFRRALKKPDIPPSSWVVGARSVRAELRRASLERIRLRQVAIPVEAPELMVNLGGGTARDMHLLHRSAVERVRRVRGVKLETRIKWVGSN
ncbi:MAG: FAD-binding protein [Alphaproteobacteria bacterium]|nr:FAD-binding protein [Alphaproteobacteria bacterium]